MPSFSISRLLLVLCTEVEGDHRGHHDHHIIGCDVTSESEDRKDGDDHKGDDSLDLDQSGKIFQEFHMITSLMFDEMVSDRLFGSLHLADVIAVDTVI